MYIHFNEPCTYISMSHVTQIHTQDAEKDTRRSQAHISTSHVTDIIESCHTYQ